ncbi:unnamed protein product [Haemonchus placei]|uniref:Secreted protein n=1 Tax=Haemonchus placei TaxID=6290 RepID=A0A0N4WEA4_HAEPC|nr:unnamed protein product [Haemonchus placei]
MGRALRRQASPLFHTPLQRNQVCTLAGDAGSRWIHRTTTQECGTLLVNQCPRTYAISARISTRYRSADCKTRGEIGTFRMRFLRNCCTRCRSISGKL